MHRHDLPARLAHMFYLHRVRLHQKTSSNPPLNQLPEGGWQDGWRPAVLEKSSVTAFVRWCACGRAVPHRFKSSFSCGCGGSVDYVECYRLRQLMKLNATILLTAEAEG
jgi:hypothetical protein